MHTVNFYVVFPLALCNTKSYCLSLHFFWVLFFADFRWRWKCWKLKGCLTVKVVHALDAPKRAMVPLNKFFQPIKRAGSLFNRFLTDIAKRANLCPLNYKEWRLVPSIFKDQNRNYIRVSYSLNIVF